MYRAYDELQTPPWALPYTLPHSDALVTGVVATAPDRPSTGVTWSVCADLVTNGGTIGSPRLLVPPKLTIASVGAPPPGWPAASLTPLAAFCASVTAVAVIQLVGSLRMCTFGAFLAMQSLKALVRSAPLEEVRSPSRSST